MKLFVEDYRPKTISECILPERISKFFTSAIEKGELQHLLLEGSAGTGKTTIARALCEQLEIDYLIINASRDLNIDMLRNQITQFASTRSIVRGDKMKAIILDEADNMSMNKVQPALRGMIEEFKDTCRFIFTCNFKNKIMEPIHSRCATISFDFTACEAKEMMKQFAFRVFHILDENEITYDRKSVAGFIKKVYPDMRKCLNELQHYSASGEIDSGILSLDVNGSRLQELNSLCAGKNWKGVRQWVSDNSDMVCGNNSTVFTQFFKCALDGGIEPNDLPSAAIVVNEYQYKHGFVNDQELNFIAMMTELMHTVVFK